MFLSFNFSFPLLKKFGNSKTVNFFPLLELKQYKNDSIQSKKLPALNLPRFFTQLHGEKKSAAISKLGTFLTELSRSCNVLALDGISEVFVNHLKKAFSAIS